MFSVKIWLRKSLAIWSGTVDLQESINGSTWDDLQTITTIGTNANGSSVTPSVSLSSGVNIVRVYFSNLDVKPVRLVF
ncbi:MAG: hypothetical protein IPN86_21605 [Saprospiraceae bacterium]|nr:hypothetical protein [Saprospiraceae bacterium]